jgi:uncharacterized membrane protein YkvI
MLWLATERPREVAQQKMTTAPSWFQRVLLPGFAFKAVVIGGGYATGRELAEFFLPSGPRGGLLAMLVATLIWSAVCVTTFLFARATHSLDYRTFFARLLGPLRFVFELAYALFIVLALAVFGAAAGAIGAALFDWPRLAGTLFLMGGIVFFTTFGNISVERLFKWVSIFLYVIYATFVVLGLTKFHHQMITSFSAHTRTDGWALGGVAYAGYNLVGAVVILPIVRHFTSDRDAVTAGLLAGPLAMLPAFLFFICMCACYPYVGKQTLPSDYLLQQMNLPVFHLAFQLMIFSALLESGTGMVHAVNERIARAYERGGKRSLPRAVRLASAATVLVCSMFLADRFGLVTLIARGYRALSYVFLSVYVLPLMTLGVWRLRRLRSRGDNSLKNRSPEVECDED